MAVVGEGMQIHGNAEPLEGGGEEGSVSAACHVCRPRAARCRGSHKGAVVAPRSAASTFFACCAGGAARGGSVAALGSVRDVSGSAAPQPRVCGLRVIRMRPAERREHAEKAASAASAARQAGQGLGCLGPQQEVIAGAAQGSYFEASQLGQHDCATHSATRKRVAGRKGTRRTVGQKRV